MAKACPICGKGTIMVGKRNLLRGKYNPIKKTRKYPNFQWAKLASGKRIKICASCLKRNLHLKTKVKM
jgi:ribosomal protein L28